MDWRTCCCYIILDMFFYFQKVAYKYKNVNFCHISVGCIEFNPYSRLNILVNFVKKTIYTAICYNKYKKIYSILKIVDFLLLCVGIPIIILNYVNITVMISAIFILAFALIEWINYYKIRLSYSYNPLVLLRRIKNRKLSKSRLAREISKR